MYEGRARLLVVAREVNIGELAGVRDLPSRECR